MGAFDDISPSSIDREPTWGQSREKKTHKHRTTMEDIFRNSVVDGKGDAVSVEDLKSKKFVGIYFSAHWCPPCRGFTPTLAEFYNKLKAARPGELEIVFVSFDRDEEGFKDYYGSMPWLSVDFANKELREELATKFNVSGIPMFLVMDKDGNVIINNARGQVESDPNGDKFPWQ